jgi:CRP/FNR family cyclic AMP-dependent transcriptional regulator
MESMHGIIARHPMAEGLSRENLAVLVACATCASFHKGQLLFSEGDSAQNFYLIQSGKIALELNRGDERMQIDVIGPGSVLGWAWMFPPYYWHFDARIIEPTRLISFYGKRLREECEHDRALGYRLANYMAGLVIQRLQKTRRQLLLTPKAPKVFSALVPN